MKIRVPLSGALLLSLCLVGCGLSVKPTGSPKAAGAPEPICPGGASPRADIFFCDDFEKTTGCSTGQESDCWNNNGLNNSGVTGPDKWFIKQGQSDAAVGTGYAIGRPAPGTTSNSAGPTKDPLKPTLPGYRFPNITWRWYQRMSEGRVAFDSGHGPAVLAYTADYAKGSALKWQTTTYNGEIHLDGLASCGGGLNSLILMPNQGTYTPLLNNRWYRLELQGILDTSCSNMTTSPWSGCNGQIRAWVDGVLTHKYLNMNLGAQQCGNNFGWYMLMPLEDYHHTEMPPWGGAFSVDNIVVSDLTGITPSDTQVIGPAVGEYSNGRGTGDTASPYGHVIGEVTWRGRHTGDDCSPNGYLGPYRGTRYLTGGTLDPTITHGGTGSYPDGCVRTVSWIPGNMYSAGTPGINALMKITDGASPTDCTIGGGTDTHYCRFDGTNWVATANTDNSLKVNVTSSPGGGGIFWQKGDAYVFPQWVTTGWIYLPSTNNYSVTNLALSGWVVDGNFGNTNQGYVGISVSGGNWSVDQKNTSGVHGAIVSTTAVTFNTWHKYELIVWNNGSSGCSSANGCVTLMIDGTRIITKQALPQSASWVFSSGNAWPFHVIGVIDFQGTAPFVAYFDDATINTVSAWSCDGWGAASCPFGTGGGGIGGGLSAPNLVVQ